MQGEGLYGSSVGVCESGAGGHRCAAGLGHAVNLAAGLEVVLLELVRLLASIYPSASAMKVLSAEALRYE
jgi:hypothetical protein